MRSDEDRSGRPRTPGPRQPDLGHAGATTEEIRCHTLEFAAVGPAFGNRLRHGGCGATTESSPGAPRRSNSPPISNWSPRSPTSSGFTLDPPRTRSCFRQPGHELPGLLAVTASPSPRTPFPDVADQLHESTPTDQHLHAVGGQTLCAGWAMNRPVCATCRSRRRPDKDVLALRADQKDAHHATVGIILSSA